MSNTIFKFPDSFKSKLKEKAKKHGMSMNSYVMHCLLVLWENE
ncbi:MAG: toxin-antitoxin system HicB family antitoxin [bacterium]